MGFLDPDALRLEPADARLLAVKEGADSVGIAVRSGRPPFTIERGGLPAFGSGEPLSEAPHWERTLRDELPGDAAYRLAP